VKFSVEMDRWRLERVKEEAKRGKVVVREVQIVGVVEVNVRLQNGRKLAGERYEWEITNVDERKIGMQMKFIDASEICVNSLEPDVIELKIYGINYFMTQEGVPVK